MLSHKHSKLLPKVTPAISSDNAIQPNANNRIESPHKVAYVSSAKRLANELDADENNQEEVKQVKKQTRKSSTPEKYNRRKRQDNYKNKQPINLFERNIVDELVDQHTIQIEEGNNLATVYDFDDEDGLGTEYSNIPDLKLKHDAKSLQNNGVHLPMFNNDDDDERETMNNTEGDEEVCISMLLKDDPRLTVSFYVA